MKIGDKVAVLDEDISGKITHISKEGITLEDSHGFEYKYSEKELIVENSNLLEKDFSHQNIAEILSEKQIKKNKKSVKIKAKERNLPPMVIDLHIHQLVSKTRGMDNYDMMTIQIDTAKRQLEYAISKRIQKIVFIHGVGEGVLRTELEFLLNRYDNIKFYDADYQNTV